MQITAELIDELLREQDLEFQAEFEIVNHLLHSTICDAPEDELLAAGEKLIRSDAAKQRTLGVRLLRELRQHAGKAASDMAGLLHREQDDGVIYWIASAFGFLDSEPVTNELTSLAKHEDPGVRYHVATALANRSSGELPDESLTALTALAGDPDAEVRFSAVFELGTWWQVSQDPRIEAVLGTALKDEDPHVLRAARDALGDQVPRRADPATSSGASLSPAPPASRQQPHPTTSM
jgi:HEAT repeat protein